MSDYIIPGEYRATAISSTCALSKDGDPYIKVTFEIEETGEQVIWFGSAKNEKSQEYLVKDLRTLGYAGNDPDELLNKDGAEARALLPNTVLLKIEDKEFQGEKQSRVRFINPVEKPMFKAGAGLFGSMKAALLAKPLGGASAPKAAAKPAPKPAPAPAYADDDVPF